MFGFQISAAPVSGSDIPVASASFNGTGPCRLYIKNSGGQDLTGCDVKVGPDTDNLHSLDAATFATLASGAMTSLRLVGPVHAVAVEATCAAGTTLDLWLADEAKVTG